MIELLDPKKQWAKIKSGWNSSNRLFRSPPKPPSHPFRNGIDPMTEQAHYSAMPASIVPAFGGKTYSERK